MSTNYKVAAWERDCEKIQEQFTSRLYTETIRNRQVYIITRILMGMMLITYIAVLYFTREDTPLLTLAFSICLFIISLNLLIFRKLVKRKKRKLEHKLLRESDLHTFYDAHKKGNIAKIKYIQDNTVIYEIKKNNGGTFNWVFTVDKVKLVDSIDTYIIHATNEIVKIEVPANSFY